eukprot:scaffold128876_cov40-Prasinocladus_malaysianus.AAC.2
MPDYGEVLRELVSILGLQSALHLGHQLLQTVGKMSLLVNGLAGYQLVLYVVVERLVDEDEAEHGSAEAPLVGALFKQHNLKKAAQDVRELIRQGSDVLRHLRCSCAVGCRNGPSGLCAHAHAFKVERCEVVHRRCALGGHGYVQALEALFQAANNGAKRRRISLGNHGRVVVAEHLQQLEIGLTHLKCKASHAVTAQMRKPS